MKICFLSDYRSIHTLRWIKFFVERNEVYLITLEGGEDSNLSAKDYEQIGVKIHVLPKGNMVGVPFQVRKLIRQIGPDVIHAHYITHYGFLAAFSGFHPVVMTAWGTDVLIEPHASFIKNFQVKYALKRADLLTCDGENTAQAMVGLGQRAEKIKRIYFGVDTKRCNPSLREESFFDDLKKDKSGKVVINIRGFGEVYDPDTFIKAIPPVLERFPGTVFVMARGGDRRKIYEDMVKSMGIADSVKFIGDIQFAKLPVYLASADVYVSTSVSDSGIAASTAEAMANGLPVISTEVGDIRIWVEEGKNGFVIQKGDEKKLADDLIDLLSDDQKRKAIGKEARRTIEERQDYYKEMAKMENIYQELAKGAKK